MSLLFGACSGQWMEKKRFSIRLPHNNVHVGVTILPWSPVKYLSLHVDQRFTWRKQVEYTKAKFLVFETRLVPAVGSTEPSLTVD